MRVLVDELDDASEVSDHRPNIVTGFVEIDSAREIEVTATYRARTNSATISGGAGSDVDPNTTTTDGTR